MAAVKVLEKPEETEIKLPTFAGSLKKQESSRKTSISVLLTMPKPLTVWITINCGKFWKMGILDHLTYLLRNLYAGQEATVRTGYGTTDWFQVGKVVHVLKWRDSRELGLLPYPSSSNNKRPCEDPARQGLSASQEKSLQQKLNCWKVPTMV